LAALGPPSPRSAGRGFTALPRSPLRLFHRANVDLRCQRAVDRTFVGALEKPPPLLRVEGAAQGDRPIDAVEHALLRLAVRAVRSVNARVIEPDRHPLERQCFALGIEAKRHGGASSQSREQQIVRTRAAVEAADLEGLVGEKAVRADRDFLLKAPSPG